MTVNPSRPFTPTSELVNASPSTVFTFFLFHRWDVYLDAMMSPEKINIDAATASLLSTCTDKDQRKKFWDDYVELKRNLTPTDGVEAAAITASILTSGDFFAYIAEACEFVEKSTGAAM